MLLPIIILLIVLSPVLIPAAITAGHAFVTWRNSRAARPVRSFAQVRPAVGLVPAAA
jgi:hypothetical protein